LTRKRHVFTDSTVIAGQNNTVPEDNFLFKDTPEFLRWGGPAGQLIREFDWAATPLGTIGLWPASLKAAVGMIVRSAVPMVLLWGPEGRLIYNAGYAALAGDHHPGLLGNAVNDAWPEAAEFHDHVLRVVLAGGSLSYTDYEQTVRRDGVAQQIWLDLDYSPVLDDSGAPAGVLGIVLETTQKVLAERRHEAEQRRLAQLFDCGPSFMAMLQGPEHRFEFVNASYLTLIGGRDVLGKTVAEALPEAADQGYLDLLNQVYSTGIAFSSTGSKYDVQAVPGGPTESRYLDFVYQPITDGQGKVTGIFVEGVDVTGWRKAETDLVALSNTLEQQVVARTEALAAKDALIGAFFEHSVECYAVLARDAAGRFRYEEINPATLALYKLTREEVVGRTINELFGGEIAAEMSRHLNICLNSGRPHRYQRRHGEAVIEAVATPVPDEPGATGRVLVSAHDVTAEVAKAAALLASNKLLGEIATTDALTGIGNRRGFDEALAREWHRAKRLNSGLALLLLDVDEFKSFNDSQGHPQGDRCLTRIAACLRENLGRATDFVGRYGGEEFAALLPDLDGDGSGALVVGERLRRAVERLSIPHPASRHGIVTISVGVATAWPRHAALSSPGALASSLVNDADAALYAAKVAGRNQVIAASVTPIYPDRTAWATR
jgi:diguanylate cyclase (GGDEF)-like protein/PAS domain S-box-containing protein